MTTDTFGDRKDSCYLLRPATVIDSMIACRVTSLLLVNSVRAISSLKQTMNVVEGAKRAAARAAVDQHLKVNLKVVINILVSVVLTFHLID